MPSPAFPKAVAQASRLRVLVRRMFNDHRGAQANWKLSVQVV